MTYSLGSDPNPYIKCHQCNRKSYNAEDIRQRYCGACHLFHEENASKRITVREALLLVLDQVDYSVGNCRVNEMVGAVLSQDILKLAKQALLGEETKS